jgi:WD40 repeat protein
VWSADGSGDPLVLHGHDGWVSSAVWSPDGKRIVTASADRTVRIWDADEARELLVLTGATQSYNHAAWSPDGRRVIAASDDGTVWVWTDLEPLASVDDPRLWTASTYCLPVERRLALLNVSEPIARAQQEACVRRVRRDPVR